MKRTLILLITLFSLFNLYSQELNHLVVDAEGRKKLLGKINKLGLQKDPFESWFDKNYSDYIINTNVIDCLAVTLDQYHIKVFLGTWCGDSKREVPRFYKILDAAQFPAHQLDVIAVDNETETYKQSPTAEEQGLNVHRVPTFIFYKNDQEVNRIVESPVVSLERDIYSIVTTNEYRPKYKAVTYLENLLRSNTLEQLKAIEYETLAYLAELVNGCYELNTYAHVKLSADQSEEAIYIFDLNAKLFPYKDYVYYSLGNAFLRIKNYSEALKAYYRALSLNPDFNRAKAQIKAIKAIDNKNQ